MLAQLGGFKRVQKYMKRADDLAALRRPACSACTKYCSQGCVCVWPVVTEKHSLQNHRSDCVPALNGSIK